MTIDFRRKTDMMLNHNGFVLKSLTVSLFFVVWLQRCLSTEPNTHSDEHNSTITRSSSRGDLDVVTRVLIHRDNYTDNVRNEVTPDLSKANTDGEPIIDNTTSAVNTWNGETFGYISEEQYEAMKNVLWLYVIPVILLIGLLGNVVGILFLVHGHCKQSFYLILLALISADLIYLLTIMFQNTVFILNLCNRSLAQTLNCYAASKIRALQWVTYSVCTHLIALMAFERLLNLLYPFWRRNDHCRRQTIAIILIVIAVNIILRIPAFLKHKPQQLTDSETNVTICVPVETAWAKVNRFWQDDYVVLMLAITQCVPLVATISANVSITILLSRQRLQRAVLFADKTTRGHHYQQYITTLTLVVLSVCLTTSLLPSITMTTLGINLPETYGRTGRERITAAFVSEIGYFLRVISSSTDFIIYIWLSKSSRTRLMQLIKGKLGCSFEEDTGNDLDLSQRSRGTEDTS